VSDPEDKLPLADIARIRAIVDCVVSHDKTGADRLLDKPISANNDFWDALRQHEADFGHRFSPLPDDFLIGMRVYVLNDGSGWSIDQALWSEHGEMSDLILILDVIRAQPRNKIEIYDLRVP
jgi:hypothetical protein